MFNGRDFLEKTLRKNPNASVKVIVGRTAGRNNLFRGKDHDFEINQFLATAILGATTSVALAQTAAQHNGPGGPKDKVEKFVNQYELTLPPPPPTPPSTPVSTTIVTSPSAAPPKKK